MPWSLLLTVFIEFVTPLLLKWLEDLLKRSVAALEKEMSPNLFPTNSLQELVVWSKAHELLEREGLSISWWNWWGKAVHARKTKIFNRLMEQGAQRLGQLSENVKACALSKSDITAILKD